MFSYSLWKTLKIDLERYFPSAASCTIITMCSSHFGFIFMPQLFLSLLKYCIKCHVRINRVISNEQRCIFSELTDKPKFPFRKLKKQKQ